MRLHVAVNALFLDPPMGGLEAYVRELCAALLRRSDAPHLSVFLPPSGQRKLQQEDWAGEATLIASERMGARGWRALSELIALGPVADRSKADVIHSMAMTGPLYSRAARVVTVADTTWLSHPTQGSATHTLWRQIVPRVARRADEVIAISHTAASDITSYLGVPSDRMTVTPLGSGLPPRGSGTPEVRLRADLGLGAGPIVLNVGQRGHHRNLERLVDAVAILRASIPTAQLVLPGYAAPELDAPLRARAQHHGIEDAVHFIGYVDDDTLEGLYACAGVLAMPSMVEGFGLPVLEALQRGAPVACSANSAPSEIMGDAGVTFDPLNADSIGAALLRVLADEPLRRRLTEAGPLRAAEFSWEDCAERTLAVYHRAVS